MIKFLSRLLFLFLFFGIAAEANAQTAEYSKDEYRGDWEDNVSWVNGVAPVSPVKNMNIAIDGFITRNTPLIIEKNSILAVRPQDTLVINSDFQMDKEGTLDVASDALFIVFGDFNVNKDTNLENLGTIVVTGTFNFSKDVSTLNGGRIITYDTAQANSTLGLSGDGSSVHVDELNGNGNPEDQVLYEYISTSGGSSLPVELAFFEASLNVNHVELTWATYTELNFDYFKVMRSVNEEPFKEIGKVAGAGYSNDYTSYTFKDKSPVSGVCQYELIAIDLDGSKESHGIRTVEVTAGDGLFSIYPNPVENRYFVVESDISLDQHACKLYDMRGNLVLVFELQIGENRIEIPTDLSTGMYGLQIQKPLGISYYKLLVN